MKNTKTLIVLAIVLLTTLSATLSGKFDATTLKKKVNTEDSLIIKLDQFDAKTYRATYERKKRMRQLRIDTMQKL